MATMGLQPLEFTDGLTDSPVFRRTLQEHERELEKTNNAIKHLIKDVRELIAAARHLSRAQRTLSETLNCFNFECIGSSLTDDEMVIASSFKDFARLLSSIEDERDRLLVKADEAFLEPIERFRREQIGNAKAAKKSFEKETIKYYALMERYLGTSLKKGEAHVQESDASYSIEQWHYYDAMSKYVLKLQEVNERKKFEFVENVLSFMLGWLTFYHQGHEIANDFYSAKIELQMRLQRTRNNFNMTQAETKSLRQKMLTNKERFKQNSRRNFAREGYLFMMEKKAFSTSWNRYFAQYEKETGRLVLLNYNSALGKTTGEETLYVKEVVRRPIESIDRRFCFDVFYWTEPPNALGNIGHEQHHSGQPGGGGGGEMSMAVSGPSSSNVVGGAGGFRSSQSSSNASSSISMTASTSTNASNGVVESSSAAAANGSGHLSYNVSILQALDDEDYKCWLEVFEAREPTPVEMQNAGTAGKSSAKGSLKSVITKSAAAAAATFTNGHKHNKESGSTGSGGDNTPGGGRGRGSSGNTPPLEPVYQLDYEGFCFVRKCIESIERRGLEQKGIYRVVGVASKVKALMEEFVKHRAASRRAGLVSAALAAGKTIDDLATLDVLPDLNLDHEDFEIKTITSALKNYLRHLGEPIMTFQLHVSFINSAKIENLTMRIERIHHLVHRLPELNFRLLRLLIEHLKKVTEQSEENLMTASNLGVCFGPTLLRPAEESVAAILDIKFVNVIAELLVEHYELFFFTEPGNSMLEANQQQQQQQQQPAMVHPDVSKIIQQRPLPNVPLDQQQQQQQPIYGTTMVSVTRGPLGSEIYGYRNFVPPGGGRSVSQEQLYGTVMASKSSMGPATAPKPTSQAQISPRSQYQHIQQQQQQYYQQQHAKQQPQPHPSGYTRSISQIVPSQNYVVPQQQQQPQPQHPMIYQSPLLLKQVTRTNGQQQQQQQQQQQSLYGTLQPSMSYQNLAYNSTAHAKSGRSFDQTDMKMLGNQLSSVHLGGGGAAAASNGIYARPMTSLAVLAPNNSTAGTTNNNNRAPLVVPTNRTFNLSSTTLSSNSLPSPEMLMTAGAGGANAADHFNYAFANQQQQQQQQQAYLKSRYMQPSPSVTDNAAMPFGGCGGKGSPNSSVSIDRQSSQTSPGYLSKMGTAGGNSIYGTIGSLRASMSSTAGDLPTNRHGAAAAAAAAGNSTVRTKYVCIGSNPSELSFEPNQIISNVHPSSEPGWLEGTLNGKTGLVPYNYVEFVDVGH